MRFSVFLPLFALVRLSFPEASLRCLHEYEAVWVGLIRLTGRLEMKEQKNMPC